MARLSRLVIPGELHLVVHRARDGTAVFRDGLDRRAYLLAAAASARDAGVALHAYSLLPDEVRLLATPAEPQALARFMQAIGRRYVRGFNDRYHTTGTPWEGRFRSCVVEADRYLECLRFVESAAGGEASGAAPDRDISSVGQHLGRWVDTALSEHPAFWRLGNTPFDREAAYRSYLAEGMDAAAAKVIRHSALHGWVLGSQAFAERLSAQAQRPAQPRQRGRKKSADSGPGAL